MSFELNVARAQVQANRKRAPYLSLWRHKRSGHVYRVRAHVLLEATLEPAVSYYERFGEPDIEWVRPASEFFDGRFEQVGEEAT